MNRSGSSLASFLPPRSFVMARREETLVFVAEASPHGFEESSEGALYRKILEAMKLSSDRAVLVFHEDPDLGDRIREHRPATVVFFGGGAMAVEGLDLAGVRVIVTESLSAMVAEPGRKRSAWEELKRAIPESRK
jgi:hypothetical protein